MSAYLNLSETGSVITFFLLLFCILILKFFQSRIQNPLYSWFRGLLISKSFLLIGIITFSKSSPGNLPENLDEGYWLCEVNDFPLPRSKSYKMRLKLTGLYTDGSIVKQKQSILAWFERDSLSEQLHPGDMLVVHMRPARPGQYGNPEEFNYREYLYRNGIYYQVYVRSEDWILISRSGRSVRYFPEEVRQTFVNRIRDAGGDEEELGVITALATGSKDYLNREIRASYSEAGAMHVLAVSGLHVGLVWFVLNLLFSGLKKTKITSGIYYFLMIGLLWIYVLITGMSASVTRAGVMLTIIILSGIAGRGMLNYNPVFLSAFLLLVINPFLLFDAGFQFSYMAVLGILFFQPRLKKMYTSSNRIFTYLFDLFSVSVAAQAGTCILSIFYFNKFPVYFLLTNIIVIPLVTVILILILASFFFWWIDPVFIVLVRLETFLTMIMNKGVRSIESLPSSSLHDLYIDRVEVIILLVIYIFLHIFFVNKQIIHMKCIIILAALLCLYGGLRDWHAKHEPTYTVLYNIPGILALDIVDKERHYLVTAGLTAEQEERIIRSCQKFWLKKGISQPVFIDLYKKDMSYEGITVLTAVDDKIKLIIFREWQIAVINDFSELDNYSARIKLKPDMIVINGGGRLKIPSWVDLSASRCIVVSSGITGRLYISELPVEMEKSPGFMDVRSGGAMLEYFRTHVE